MDTTTCPACGAAAERGQWACSACGASFVDPNRFDRSRRATTCPRCDGPIVHGGATLRTDHTTGWPASLFAIHAPEPNQLLAVETRTCTRCGHLDLYLV